MARERCEACFRLKTLCLCEPLPKIDNAVEVLFLQHPMEKLQVKGSARLTFLSLRHAHWQEGEAFDVIPVLEQWLQDNMQVVLLYPLLGDKVPSMTPESLVLDLADDGLQEIKLVVLDGTWKKTRKMLFLNPQLASLPRLEVVMTSASHYAIRKQKNAQTYSTLEAIQQALSDLEKNAEKYAPLSRVLKDLVAQQTAFRPN